MSPKRWIAAGVAVVTAVTLTNPSPAGAIVYGEPTTEFGNVGSLLITTPPDHALEGATVQVCTGTLIAPDVVLTAAHCIVGLPDWPLSFTFDPVIDAEPDGLVDGDVTRIAVESATGHEAFGSGGANDTHDIGVLEFERPFNGITPAPLPSPGQLDARAAKAATYTAVGYGTTRDSRKTAWQGIGDSTGRMFADQTVNSVTKSWITFSMNEATGNGGTCYGDSGGPHFAEDGTVVSITVTGDSQCKSTDKTYRVDTAVARDFLDDFVDLPG